MIKLRVSDDLKFTSLAAYRIFIKGFLDESWSDRLNGMTIGHLNSDAGLPVTKLCGKVQDQAELLGVLNSIYEMHLPLISLELIEDFEAESRLPDVKHARQVSQCQAVSHVRRLMQLKDKGNSSPSSSLF